MRMRYTIPLTLLLLGALPEVNAAGAQEVRILGMEGNGYLGVRIRDVNADDVSKLNLPREKGVYIERVEPGSPAEEAKLVEGDVVLEFGGIPLLSARHLTSLVGFTNPGQSVEVTVWRSGREQRLAARIGEPKGAWKPRMPQDFGLREFFPDGNFKWNDRRFRVLPHGEGIWSYLGDSGSPRLGISGTPLTDQMASFLGLAEKKGVLVTEVLVDSAAERAGLKAGDVIMSVDGKAVNGLSELRERLSGEEVTLEVLRKQERLTFKVALKEPSDDDSERSKL